jgi:hypothetical protein
MLGITHDNTAALDGIAWPTAVGLAIDRTTVETWSEYVVDNEPADGATQLECGYLYTARVLYADGNLDVVGWSESHEDMQALAFKLAIKHELSVTYYPALIRHLRAQIN